MSRTEVIGNDGDVLLTVDSGVEEGQTAGRTGAGGGMVQVLAMISVSTAELQL